MSLPARLRRIALDRQGLLRTDCFGRGKQAALRAVERLGYVQIDTISVVERAHHHVLWSRIGNYRPEFLERLVRERRLFEYWFHAAAWLPMRDYRYALPRMALLHGDRGWFPDSKPGLLRDIVRRIEAEGPLRTRDFGGMGRGKAGWWDWKPAKQALEQLFMQGELMVSRRDGFEKVYDLPERVIPDWVDTRPPSPEEYANYLVDTTLRAHGFAGYQSFTYLRKGKKLRDAVKAELRRRVDAGRLTALDCSGGTVYIEPELLDTPGPRSQARARILSPFDNSIIQRDRVRQIFDFDYQIECYLPRGQRRFGYFCLPILYRDRFVGRVDCKAHRAEGRLGVRALYIESDCDERFADALCLALTDLAGFNACTEVTFGEKSFSGIPRPMRQALLAGTQA